MSTAFTAETCAAALPQQGGRRVLLLQDLVCGSTESCTLRPMRFFVSWCVSHTPAWRTAVTFPCCLCGRFVQRCGVLVIAYEGFPPALESLKKHLNDIASLPKENPGSRCVASGPPSPHAKQRTCNALSGGQRLHSDA